MSAPNLHIFNPSSETAIANGTLSYVPNKILLQFENDLSYLPSILAKNEDLVLMNEYEDLSHIDLLHSLSFPVPGQILKRDFFEPQQKIISEIQDYKLWGFAPNWVHKLKKHTAVSSPQFESNPFYNWTEIHKNIFSRTEAKKILDSIISSKGNSIYISENNSPTVLFTTDQVEHFLNKHRQVVLKEPWSSSGRGVIMLRKSTLNTSIIQRINGILKQQGYIMAEPMLDKLIDLSMQFEMKNRELNFIGTGFFSTNSNGQYQANFLNQVPEIDKDILEFMEANIVELKSDLIKAIESSKISEYYQGFLGVDVMIVNENNKIKFQPCVEINLRSNMGTIALYLQKIIHPEAKGTFNIVFNPKETFESIYGVEQQDIKILDGRMHKGTLAIVSPVNKRFGAYIQL